MKASLTRNSRVCDRQCMARSSFSVSRTVEAGFCWVSRSETRRSSISNLADARSSEGVGRLGGGELIPGCWRSKVAISRLSADETESRDGWGEPTLISVEHLLTGCRATRRLRRFGCPAGCWLQAEGVRFTVAFGFVLTKLGRPAPWWDILCQAPRAKTLILFFKLGICFCQKIFWTTKLVWRFLDVGRARLWNTLLREREGATTDQPNLHFLPLFVSRGITQSWKCSVSVNYEMGFCCIVDWRIQLENEVDFGYQER